MAAENNGVTFLQIPAFCATGLVHHGFSTRLGGVSAPPYDTMNLGWHRGDCDEAVAENYRLFCLAVGVDESRLVRTRQLHGDTVLPVGAAQIPYGWQQLLPEGVDGLVTDEPGVALMTYHADCVPLFFLDPVKRVIGLTHAGWRGTVRRIGAKTVELMGSRYGCHPEDILGAIGPCAGPCCYEVDQSVASLFDPAFVTGVRPGHFLLDLWQANVQMMLDCGLTPEHITRSDDCTICHPERYYSHRKTNGIRGSMAAVMELIK